MSDEKVFHLVYVSAATHPLDKADLLQMLKEARERNQQLGVTGLLLYKDGDFTQLLEGDKATVKALFQDSIRKDPPSPQHPSADRRRGAKASFCGLVDGIQESGRPGRADDTRFFPVHEHTAAQDQPAAGCLRSPWAADLVQARFLNMQVCHCP